MTLEEIVMKLPKERLEELRSNIVELGIAHEFGESIFNDFIDRKIKSAQGTFRTIYKYFRSVDKATRDRVFDIIID